MTPEEWAGIVERANRQDMSASAAYRDRRALIAEVVRLQSLVMVYRPVYEAVRDTPGNTEVARALRLLASIPPKP